MLGVPCFLREAKSMQLTQLPLQMFARVKSHSQVNYAGYNDYRPPKSFRNDLNNRPGKVAAFCGRPWNC